MVITSYDRLYPLPATRYTLGMTKIVAQNRRARFDYDITETVEAGIVLTGQEVKSCRLGQISLAGSYVSFMSGRPMLKQAKISQYKFAGDLKDYDPGHDRLLLLRKSELERLEQKQAEKGVTIIPLEVRADKFIKVVLGLAKGRRTIDKRQRIKEREVERKIRQGRE